MVLLKFIKALPIFWLWVMAFLFGSVIYLSDRLAAWILRLHRRSEYVLKGGCARTGQCCRNLALQFPKSWLKQEWLVKFITGWYRQVFNFHYIGRVHGNWLVFECHYLKNGDTCGIYPYRPKLCREYPLTPLMGHGRLHKGCGFWFVKRQDEGSFQESLERQAHEQERAEYLRESSQENLNPTR